MIKHLLVIGSLGLLPGAPSAAEAASANDNTWAFLKTPLPGSPASCPTAQAVGGGLVKVSLFDEKASACPVAAVEGEPISLDELNAVLASAHQSRGGAFAHGAKQDATAILNRLIDARLVVLEARAVGLDELPEAVRSEAEIKATVGREMLQAQVLKDVKADPKEVERIFKNAVREWKLDSVLFVREADAKAMVAAVKKGGDFDKLAAEAAAAKKAKGGSTGGQYVDASKLVLPVLGAVEKLKKGGVSAPVKLQDGYAVVQVEDIRYPENAKAGTEAEAQALTVQKRKALRAYYAQLEKKYATIDRTLLKKVDFDAKTPGIEGLKKDKRVVARVQGTPDITIGDVAARLEQQFFHSADVQAQKGKLNKGKEDALDLLVSPRIVALEVEKQGFAKTDEFARRVTAATNAYLFGAFVEKMIVQDVKLTEADVQKYYDAHKAEYTYPAFYKLQSIAFASKKDAEGAVAKLRAGTDFKWLNANAEGKLPDGAAKEAPSGTLSAKAMEPGLLKALDGTKNGDFRVYPAPHDQFFAVQVLEVVPPAAQPLVEVRDAIAQKVYADAVQKAVEDYIAKLRKAHKFEVFLARIGG